MKNWVWVNNTLYCGWVGQRRTFIQGGLRIEKKAVMMNDFEVDSIGLDQATATYPHDTFILKRFKSFQCYVINVSCHLLRHSTMRLSLHFISSFFLLIFHIISFFMMIRNVLLSSSLSFCSFKSIFCQHFGVERSKFVKFLFSRSNFALMRSKLSKFLFSRSTFGLIG